MLTEKIDLYEYFKLPRPENGAGYLTVLAYDQSEEYCPGRIRPAMLVIGGGGYNYVSAREKEPVALEYINEGFNAFILDYSCKPVTFPAQLIEGCMATIYIRENAEKYHIDPEEVAAIGFSAGGHCLGLLAFMYDAEEVKAALGEKYNLAKLDAAIFSYAVITSGEKAHRGSIDNVSGGDKNLVERLSLENRVTPSAPPAFIWCTENDSCVPSENSLYLALAYRKSGVPYELHVFENGTHGLSIATEEVNLANPAVAKWVKLSLTWLKNRGFKIKNVK